MTELYVSGHVLSLSIYLFDIIAIQLSLPGQLLPTWLLLLMIRLAVDGDSLCSQTESMGLHRRPY